MGEQGGRVRHLARMIKSIFLMLGMRSGILFFIKPLVKMHYSGMYKLGQILFFPLPKALSEGVIYKRKHFNKLCLQGLQWQ